MQTTSFHTFQKQLGAHIQALRKARGLSQEQVGSLLDMDRVSIGYIEQGKRAPKLSTLYFMAEVLDVEIKDFFDFQSYPQIDTIDSK